MVSYHKGFTLIEVLISISLLGIIMIALFSSVDILRESNQHLLKHLQKSKKITKSTKLLYKDILASDGNLTISRDEFSRLCIEETSNSLYGLSVAKVCWLVLKDKNTLIRVEGNFYQIPTKDEDKIEIDTIMSGVELFDVHHQKDKVLVLLKQTEAEPISFMLQGIVKDKPKKTKGKKSSK